VWDPEKYPLALGAVQGKHIFFDVGGDGQDIFSRDAKIQRHYCFVLFACLFLFWQLHLRWTAFAEGIHLRLPRHPVPVWLARAVDAMRRLTHGALVGVLEGISAEAWWPSLFCNSPLAHAPGAVARAGRLHWFATVDMHAVEAAGKGRGGVEGGGSGAVVPLMAGAGGLPGYRPIVSLEDGILRTVRAMR